MNPLKKIGLGIGALAIATLPFCMREKQPEELVDILREDAYESYHEGERNRNNVHDFFVKEYRIIFLKEEKFVSSQLLVTSYTAKQFNTPLTTKNRLQTKGVNIIDTTPQTIEGETFVGCNILDQDDNNRKDFTPEEIQALEEKARTHNIYRQKEKEIFRDVEKNGTIITEGTRTLIDIPIIKEWFKVSDPILMHKTYHLEGDCTFNVRINVRSGEINTYELVVSQPEDRPSDPFGGPAGHSYEYPRYDCTTMQGESISETFLDAIIKNIRGER